MPGAELSRDPRAVVKGSSGSPRAVFMEISGTPSRHKHGVGGVLLCERSKCQAGLGAQPPRKGGLGSQLHAAVSIENDKFWVDELAHGMSVLDEPVLDEVDSTPDLRDAERLTIEELISLLAERMRE
jgi:hypothetical protein